MHSYIALLRGINLGNRRPKMDELRALFQKMKFRQVSTFIASGNVIFESSVKDAAKVESLIQTQLEKALGYRVDTFVRTRAEIAAVAAHRPFPKADFENPSHTVHVGFLAQPLSSETAYRFAACRTDVDEFRVEDREYYWLCRIKTNESKVWTLPEVKALKLPSSTMRNLTTIRKLAALYRVSLL